MGVAHRNKALQGECASSLPTTLPLHLPLLLPLVQDPLMLGVQLSHVAGHTAKESRGGQDPVTRKAWQWLDTRQRAQLATDFHRKAAPPAG